MTKKQHYMKQDERYRLEGMLRAGKPVAWIARELGFSRQTIYNEMKRGAFTRASERNYYRETIEYSADKAQQKHEYNQTAKGRPLKIGHERAYAEFLEKMVLDHRYSPAAALAAARREGFTISICAATFYSYIEKGVFLHLTNKALWIKGKKKKRGYQPVRRIAHPLLPSITTRPEEIKQRSEFGHWEMDLITGKAGTKPVLLTLTERKTRKEIIRKLKNRKAETIRKELERLKTKEKFRSITTDNGSEFMEYNQLIKAVSCPVYYCHSYAAWEKGSNENHNRMIRRFFPKGTDFTRITKKQIQAVEDWMNHYPRKILDWYAPCEAA